MEGCFIVYPNPDEDFDINCDLKSNNITVPDDQQNLYEEVEYVCTIIKSLHNTHDSIKRKYSMRPAQYLRILSTLTL